MDAAPGKGGQNCPQVGDIVRIIGNKRFSSQKNKLAVVVSQPKSRQRKSPGPQEKQGSPKALPIGGWHYIICLPLSTDSRPDLKPCSVQGNAIRLERATAEERSIAEKVTEQYEDLQDQDEGPETPTARSGAPTSRLEHQIQFENDRHTKFVEYCETTLRQQGISSETIQAVIAGITLFGMRSNECMDFRSILRQWKALRENSRVQAHTQQVQKQPQAMENVRVANFGYPSSFSEYTPSAKRMKVVPQIADHQFFNQYRNSIFSPRIYSQVAPTFDSVAV